jgi:acyl-CoA synthetase (NDP forming)
VRRDYRARVTTAAAIRGDTAAATHLGGDDFLSVRSALVASGIAVVGAAIAHSESEATALLQRFGTAVAVKAEAPGLLHKSDIGCVRLNCSNEREVAEAYRAVMQNARGAGFQRGLGVLVQPMIKGTTEVYAGIIDDPVFGPAICFGLGGVFIEILKDAATEMAPLAHEDAVRMIRGIKGARILEGARGRERADIDALATLLVNLGNFAVANRGRFRALDLNPIMVGPSGAIAVDIAIEPVGPTEVSTIANAAE